MNIDKDEIVRLTEVYGGQWGLNHTRRLLNLISVIAQDVTYDPEIVWLAAHLHDWGAYAPWAQEGVDHAVRSKQVAETFLQERKVPEDIRAKILECIGSHHNSGPNASVESILLRDADVIDFLGVVGILREFSKNPRDLKKAFVAAKNRSAKLVGVVQLPKAKEHAAKRIKEMDDLLKKFEEEAFGCF